MKSPVLFWTLLAFAPLRSLAAQETLVPKPGDRIRVTARECRWSEQEATFVSVENGPFSATVDLMDIGCPVSALTKPEMAQGGLKWWRASLWGTGIGTVARTATGALLDRGCHPATAGNPDSDCLAAAFGSVLGFSGGLVIGTISGIGRGSVDRETVPLPTV